MSQKRTDLAKSLNRKIQGQMQHAAIPGRFAQGAAVPDRREQRKLDQAAGLVPFAVKLSKDLVARLTELAAASQVSLHALVDELLLAGLAQRPAATPTAAQKPAGKPVAEKAPAATRVPVKKAAAKPAATKPAVKASAANPAAKAAKPSEKKATADKAPAKKAAAKKAAAKTPATQTAKTAKKAAR